MGSERVAMITDHGDDRHRGRREDGVAVFPDTGQGPSRQFIGYVSQNPT